MCYAKSQEQRARDFCEQELRVGFDLAAHKFRFISILVTSRQYFEKIPRKYGIRKFQDIEDIISDSKLSLWRGNHVFRTYPKAFSLVRMIVDRRSINFSHKVKSERVYYGDCDIFASSDLKPDEVCYVVDSFYHLWRNLSEESAPKRSDARSKFLRHFKCIGDWMISQYAGADADNSPSEVDNNLRQRARNYLKAGIDRLVEKKSIDGSERELLNSIVDGVFSLKMNFGD